MQGLFQLLDARGVFLKFTFALLYDLLKPLIFRLFAGNCAF